MSTCLCIGLLTKEVVKKKKKLYYIIKHKLSINRKRLAFEQREKIKLI